MSGNDQRSAFTQMFVNGSIENSVQCRDLSLDSAAVLYIDKRISGGFEDIACHDHIRAAEMHTASTIGHCFGLPENLHSFVVVGFPPPALQKRVGGSARIHTILNVLMPDDRRADTRIGK